MRATAALSAAIPAITRIFLFIRHPAPGELTLSSRRQSSDRLLQRSYTLVVGLLQPSTMMEPADKLAQRAAKMSMTDPEREPADSISRRHTGVSFPVLAAMNSLNLGILIVDRECRITFANEYATELLRSLGGAQVQRHPSTDRVHGASPFDKRLRKAISNGDDRADGFLALNGAGTNSLIVQIVPYASAQGGESGSILFVSDPSTKPDLDLRPTARFYGLTGAELRLLEALLNGEKAGDYAKRNGVTLNTVKGHLSQLFRKTQTCRQSELVLRILANPVFRLASRHVAMGEAEGGTIR
jgi:DNA-binding CsgD family transcriptional regulator/PAS domain-containing protein